MRLLPSFWQPLWGVLLAVLITTTALPSPAQAASSAAVRANDTAEATLKDYSGQSLIREEFTGAQLQGANFSGADLQGAVFNGSDLVGANFHGANLSNGITYITNLTDADFKRRYSHVSNDAQVDFSECDGDRCRF
jgi:uncharacterized protein YjbI with pentapeptide repeats